MAQPRVCQKCGERHFNFEKCRVRENQKDGIRRWQTRPNLHEGYRLWRKDYGDEFERYGDVIVQKGLRLKPHSGTVKEG